MNVERKHVVESQTFSSVHRIGIDIDAIAGACGPTQAGVQPLS